MLDSVLALSHALRTAGVPVAVSESMDALKAVTHLDWARREDVRAALAATLIKDQAHMGAFDVLFELYLGNRPADDAPPDADPEELLERLFDAVGSGDAGAVTGLAREAVAAFGRVENSPSDSLYFEYPVFRTLDPGVLLARLETRLEGTDELQANIDRALMRRGIADFRRAVQTEVRRRVADRKGPEAVASYAVQPLLADVELATATADEIAALRRSIWPLARRLATRLSLKHRHGRRGRVDMRRTVRHSLSTGGVPFDIAHRPRTPHRPELFVLCDVSDSVAPFARFSLMLVHALQSQFQRVRSFAFVDTIDEVTRLLEGEDFLEAVDRINTEAQVVWIDRNSNYGASLERFAERYGDEITAKTTLFILGDARSNNRPPRDHVLKELRHKAHRVYWLNPEPENFWDTGDSVASVYAPHTDGMREVRTLRQLETFVAEVL